MMWNLYNESCKTLLKEAKYLNIYINANISHVHELEVLVLLKY